MQSKRSAIMVLLVVVLAVSMTYAANEAIKRAYYEELNYYIDGKKVDKAITSVFIETTSSKTLYLPLRQIAELLGLDVNYDPTKKTVSISTSKAGSAKPTPPVTGNSTTKALNKEQQAAVAGLSDKDWRTRQKTLESLAKMGEDAGFASNHIIELIYTESNEMVMKAMQNTINAIGSPVYEAITLRAMSTEPWDKELLMLYYLCQLRIEEPKYYLSLLYYYFDANLEGMRIEHMRHHIALLTRAFRCDIKEEIAVSIIPVFREYLVNAKALYTDSYDVWESAYTSVLRALALLGKGAIKVAEELLLSEDKQKRNDACYLLGFLMRDDVDEVNRLLEEALYDYRTRDAAIDVITNRLGSYATPLVDVINQLNIASTDRRNMMNAIEESYIDLYTRELDNGRIVAIEFYRDPVKNDYWYSRDGYLKIRVIVAESDGKALSDTRIYPRVDYPNRIPDMFYPSLEYSLSGGSYYEEVYFKNEHIENDPSYTYLKLIDGTDQNGDGREILIVINDIGEVEIQTAY